MQTATEASPRARPAILGPVSFLEQFQPKAGGYPFASLERLLPVYAELLESLANQGAEWVQIDEPRLAGELDADARHAFNLAYHVLKSARVKILLVAHAGPQLQNAHLAANLPVAGLHIDAKGARGDVWPLVNLLPSNKVLSLGVLEEGERTTPEAEQWNDALAQRLGARLWISTRKAVA